ncbi:MAG: Type 1 glutamine amidotransferase-like domain-containing protein [Patescibacteria group bacterium]
MSTIFLTSTGLTDESIRNEFLRLVGLDRSRSVGIVTTAASLKSENKYAKLAMEQFKEMGFSSVQFFDIETDPIHLLDLYSILYVCGGNTFYLLYQIKKHHAEVALKNFLQKENSFYIGVSAGSMILGPTIGLASLIDPDPNDVQLVDFTGLQVIDFEIHPHYETKHEQELLSYEKEHSCRVVRLNDNQALILSNGEETLLG